MLLGPPILQLNKRQAAKFITDLQLWCQKHSQSTISLPSLLITYKRGSDIIAVIEDSKLRRHYSERLELSVTAAFIISVWHLNLRLRLAEHVARLAKVKEYICNFVTETLRKRLLGILRILDDFFLIFMDPCIVAWLSRNNQQDAALY